MTLVEVAAALALLGSLLGATVLAKGRFNHQWRIAQRRISAVKALDEQLNQWLTTTGEGNADSTGGSQVWAREGEGPMAEPWWWRSERLPQRDGATDQPLDIVRYTAFDPEHPLRRTEATVDVLVLPEAPDEPGDADESLSVDRGAA